MDKLKTTARVRRFMHEQLREVAPELMILDV